MDWYTIINPTEVFIVHEWYVDEILEAEDVDDPYRVLPLQYKQNKWGSAWDFHWKLRLCEYSDPKVHSFQPKVLVFPPRALVGSTLKELRQPASSAQEVSSKLESYFVLVKLTTENKYTVKK